MADESGVDSVAAIKTLFKWKNAESAGEATLDDPCAPGPPCPELRRDEIDARNIVPIEAASEAQMETGEVCEDGEFWFSGDGGFDDFVEGVAENAELLDYFADAHYGYVGGICDEFDSGFSHLRAAHAEDFGDAADF